METGIGIRTALVEKLHLGVLLGMLRLRTRHPAQSSLELKRRHLLRDVESAQLDLVLFTLAICAACLLSLALFSTDSFLFAPGHWDSWFTTALALLCWLAIFFIVGRQLRLRLARVRAVLAEFDLQNGVKP